MFCFFFLFCVSFFFHLYLLLLLFLPPPPRQAFSGNPSGWWFFRPFWSTGQVGGLEPGWGFEALAFVEAGWETPESPHHPLEGG